MLVVKSWDGHDINDRKEYRAGFSPAEVWGLPEVTVNVQGRSGGWPVFGSLERPAVEHSIFIAIEDESNIRALRSQLLSWFDPEDETPRKLVVTDYGGANPRFVEAICQSFRPVIIGSVAARDLFRANLVVTGDVRWRSTTELSTTWYVTASGATKVIDNPGDNDAYPVYNIKPTTAKTAGYSYRRWVPIKWRSQNSGNRYPVRIDLDTASLITAGKMQSQGQDLRVRVDGTEVPRWFGGMNSAATPIWITLNFSQAPKLKLKTAIASTGDIDSIEFTDEIEVSLLPDSGIILIDNEAFVYTGRDLMGAAVTGIKRAAKDTSMSAHSAAATCYWIQHDIYLVYGNPAASNPVYSFINKPVFELDVSTNQQWKYDYFAYYNVNMAGHWGGWGTLSTATSTLKTGRYTYTQMGPMANPHPEIGAWIQRNEGDVISSPGWYLANPCGIVNASWSGGKKYAEDITKFVAELRYWPRGASWWSNQAQISAPSSPNTYETWNQAKEATDWTPSELLAMILYFHNGRLEVSTVTAYLNTSEVPVAIVNAEQPNYELLLRFSNETTKEWLNIELVMTVGTELEIDTYNKTVKLLTDDSRQFKAISFSSSRKAWLKLQPGNNTLKYSDAGTGNVTVTVKFWSRSY